MDRDAGQCADTLARHPAGLHPAENPDTSMLRHMQRQIERQAAAFPARIGSKADWLDYRHELIEWLRQACGRSSLQPAIDHTVELINEDGINVERLELSIEGDFAYPARLYPPTTADTEKKPVLIVSHDSAQCTASPELTAAARRLAESGYWVLTPEHASMNKASQRPLPGGWGGTEGLLGLYGAGDTVGLPPLALRVADDLAACRYAASRPELKDREIVIAGLGIGGLDACLAALLEPRSRGNRRNRRHDVPRLGQTGGPAIDRYDRIMPYLPGILTQTDLDCCYAALAPRPLLVVRSGDAQFWPEAGFAHVAATARAVYQLVGTEQEFRTAEAKKLGSQDQTAGLAGPSGSGCGIADATRA